MTGAGMNPKGILWGLGLSLPLWFVLGTVVARAQVVCTPTPTSTPVPNATPISTPAAVAYVDGAGNIYHSFPQSDGCGGYTPAATVYPLKPAPAATLIADFAAGNTILTLSNPVGPDANGQYSAAISTPTPGPTAPTLALNANAGTGATIAFIAGSTLRAGGISWTAGTSPAAGTQFVVTFPSAFPTTPAAPCVAANRPAAHLGLYSTPTTTTVTVGSDVVPTAGTTYVCQYAVVLP